MNFRAFRPWLPVMLWMGVIFMMSTDLGSSEHSMGIVQWVLGWLNLADSPDTVTWAQTLIRKTGHVSEYAVLALLLLHAVRVSLFARPKVAFFKLAGIVLFGCAAYAATDEFHQRFVPGRTACVRDVLIDTGGAGVALTLAWLWQGGNPGPGAPPARRQPSLPNHGPAGRTPRARRPVATQAHRQRGAPAAPTTARSRGVDAPRITARTGGGGPPEAEIPVAAGRNLSNLPLAVMKTFPFLLIAAVLGAGGCQSLQNNPHPASPADITVKFQDPDKFFDVKDSFNAGPSQYYLDTLSQHLKQVAARRLSAGEKLTVTFTNIDLAGEIPPGSIESIRIIKEIDIPRMDLSFRLTDAAGKVISEGTRQLQNADYTSELLLPSERGQPLVFDKLLLTRWVNHEFKPAS